MIEITADGKLDLGRLSKGDFISEEVLRKVTGFDPRENRDPYSFAVLKIRESLEDDYSLICRAEGDALRVLTTSEATYYAAEQAEIARRRQHKNYGRLIKLDEREMDDLTRVQHRKHIDKESKHEAAQLQARKQIRISQTQERLSRTVQEQPITIISTKKEKKYGSTTDNTSAHRNRAPAASQRPNGEPAEPDSQTNEAADQQAQ